MSKDFQKKDSKPRLKWPSFPVVGIFIFIVYWLIITPLIFVAMSKNYSVYKPGYGLATWPIYFWVIALIIFTIIMTVCLLISKCYEKKKKGYIYIYNQNRQSCNHDKKECYIMMSDLQKRESYDSLVLNDENKIELRNIEHQDNKRRHTEFPKPKPKLEIKLRPLSQPQESVLTPMTPREVFFMDLIEAAENSPISQIPATKLFLENEITHNKAVIVHEKLKPNQNGGQGHQNGAQIPQNGAQVLQNGGQVPQNVAQVPQNVAQFPQNGGQVPQNGSQVPQNGVQAQQNGGEAFFKPQDIQNILNAHKNFQNSHSQVLDQNETQRLSKPERGKEVYEPLKNDDDSTGVIEHVTNISSDSKVKDAIFIASVTPKSSESNVVFMYIPDNPPEMEQKEFEQSVMSDSNYCEQNLE